MVDFNRLPVKMKIQNVFRTLERALKGPLFQVPPPKLDRLNGIEQACGLIVTKTINPLAFSETGSNPNSSTVKEMFSNLGVPNVFGKTKARFEVDWGRPVHDTFINDKLNEVVGRRHVIAHTANALQLTRNELKTSIRFLKILAALLDKELSLHFRQVMRDSAV